METSILNSLFVKGKMVDGADEILSDGALNFIQDLEEKFGPRRLALLQDRLKKQEDIDKSVFPDFLEETKHIRR